MQRLTHGMLYRKLGKSDLVVSEVCLGTMTWGEQTTEEQAHAQLDMAVDEYGVNFVVRDRALGTLMRGSNVQDRITTSLLISLSAQSKVVIR
jgi:predicted aldo/keto reductase-like oxidoreductase